ncbi:MULTISPECIES: lytic transglycosylase domain-containing protein [unclassified Acinetobacter]|uniref:lytic transglycosylase domain-containing protein n=1 Tax=unclassified Acinetobacter TaxID=196816 RepID=UPI00293489A1|nr:MULTISPECIES: transglycosylase SLT domain-containing protein [unclassified Acinetobacter]WOE32135.1 transglycosylase SLT domain-containing protein [Acinetobacter sp. SAAs470]WOE37605.1 transglycosylase SLT domain-containing protein [Acinetobacter sp. SAAs474]
MAKISLVVITIGLITGCAPLGSGSVAKRSAKLSIGLQKAYTVQPSTADRIAPLIVETADQYDLDPLMLAALIRQESSYRSKVVSPAGAVGLTQVMPKYWQNICQGDLFDESVNIHCGAYILNTYQHNANSLKKALAHYNVGPTAYNTNRQMKKQGKKYAKQVKAHRSELKSAL